jgi:8-hydroxy-5-deazaflavin:NADPH oxidoreductase
MRASKGFSVTYAILGSGAIGGAIATQFARQRIETLVANTRGPASLAPLAAKLGPHITPVSRDAALMADIVFLAVPFTAVSEAVAGVPDWNGRIVVDCTNAIDFPAFTPMDLGGRASSAVVAASVPGARLVKGFNTLPAAILAADPVQPDGRRVLFLSGDNDAATARVAELAVQLGFAPIQLGKLDQGSRLQQFGGALMVHSLIKQG